MSREPLGEDAVRTAGLIAFYVPMHTATRLAAELIARARLLNPAAHYCFFGLYAPVNEEYLRGLGVETVLGGEFEQGLADLAERLSRRARGHGDSSGGTDIDEQGPQPEPVISLARQEFVVPDRSGMPDLSRYARLTMPDGEQRIVGSTEATRGCKHLCRHCPIVPVYQGAFRVVGREIVLEDVRRQVAAGARHISFGDPDFFNGPAHGLSIVEAIRGEFAGLSYDVTSRSSTSAGMTGIWGPCGIPDACSSPARWSRWTTSCSKNSTRDTRARIFWPWLRAFANWA